MAAVPMGTTNSQTEAGFVQRTVRPMRARLALVIETMTPILSICGNRSSIDRPSASEIAVLTAITPTRFSESVATSTPAHSTGPNVESTRANTLTTATATIDETPNCARLNASFTERCCRAKYSASPEPIRRARTNSGGETRNRPATSGISLIENEWALRPMCRWMTFASAMKKAAASSHQGMGNGAVTGLADGSQGHRTIVSPTSTAANAQTRAVPDVAALSRAARDIADRGFGSNRHD